METLLAAVRTSVLVMGIVMVILFYALYPASATFMRTIAGTGAALFGFVIFLILNQSLAQQQQ